jgi:hypothetical protein
MAIPAGWSLGQNNSYTNNRFNVNGIDYQISVNSQTGNAELYSIDVVNGNKKIASTDSGNNWQITDQDAFLKSIPAGTTTKNNLNTYFSTNFTLPLNQYRSSLINGANQNTSSFTNTPGVNNVQLTGSTTTPISSATPITSLNPIDQIKQIIGLIQDPLSSADEIAGGFDGNEGELFANFLLKYPIDLLDKRQDTLSISQYRYQAPQNDIFKPKDPDNVIDNFNRIINDGLTRGIDYQKTLLGKVILPMPNRVSDSNNVGWGGDEMSALNAAVGSDVASRMPEYLGAFLGGQGLNIAGAPINGSQLTSAMVLLKLLQNFTNKNVKTSAGAGLVSTIAGAAGYEIPPESILSRGFGIIPNSNLELLFTGPQLRQFAFAYRLSPRSSTEARAVRNILRFFKQGMSARKSSSGSNFFLGTPNVFQLQYKYDGINELKGVNKIKTCALTGFAVDYAPDGMWASYEQGQPASVTINMSFSELEPIYNTDYSTSNNVSNDSVGF